MLACAGASVAALALVFTTTASAATPPAAAPSADGATVALGDSASPAAARTPQVGSAAASTAINFEVDLALPDQQAAVAFAAAVSTPGSALYGHDLTPAQWEARFSPTATEVSEVEAFLTRRGLSVTGVSGDRMAISVTGTAQQVAAAFATTLAYHLVGGQRLLLAQRDLSVPATLARVIAGVTGVNQTLARPDDLTDGPVSQSGPLTVSGASAAVTQPAGFRTPQPCGSYFGQKLDSVLPQYPGYAADPPWAVCGYTGPQYRSAYGLTGAETGAETGAGVTVAIIDAYMSPTLYQDAGQFASTNDPSNPLSPSQFSELPSSFYALQNYCGNTGWYGEQTLDVEAVHDTAPGADILAVGASSCSNLGLDRALRTVIDGHLAQVITNSYGDDAGDALDSAGDRHTIDDLLLMADGTGVSVMFSSGDNGDEFTTTGLVAADYPASSPYATAVGGTSLAIGAQGQRLGEYGWSTARSFYCNQANVTAGGCTSAQLGTWLPVDLALDGGSGGGTSVVYPQPAWQAGVVPASLSQRNGSTPMRVVPDISLDADPGTGMLVGETQTFPDGTYYDQYRIGGTSVASPLLAGVVARADETAGHALGFLNPLLYSLSGDASAIDDILPTHQDQSRADFVDGVNPLQGYLFSTRVIDYEGSEQYCDPTTNQCTTAQVALSTAPGYDSMTGLGSPAAGFVQALSQR
jgi:subtilase family serine protease